MQYSTDQLARLTHLADAWLDVPADQRAVWRASALREHPDLVRALAAMTGDDAAPGDGPALTTLAGDVAQGNAATQDGSPAEQHGDARACHRPGDSVGPYRLERQLGEGGMGTVWLAEQVDGRVHRQVALKLLRPEHTHPGWRLRFERERDILAGMNHPGIARLFEAGSTAEGQPYLAMQYVAGEPLGRHANRRGLGVDARVRLAVELLGAVQHAHSLLVVHRDLKPGNILVDEAGRVVLLDFGIAKLVAVDGAAEAAQGAITELTGTALTLDYASPEQVAGRPVGIGTDLYSLGVVLYELLCGQRPYRLQRGSRAAVEQAILEQDIQPPSRRVVAAHAAAVGLTPQALARRLRGDLDSVVLKALRREVGERYATADAMADDLRRCLDGRPVSAQPQGTWYLTRRYVQRHRWAVAGATLTFAGLAAGLGVALWQANVAREQAQLARTEATVAQETEHFLTSMFSANDVNQTDPSQAANMTARELLDVGARRIQTELEGAPEVKMRLLDTLTSLYNDRGLYDKAMDLKKQVVALRRTLHPDAKLEQFDDVMDLALLQIEMNSDSTVGTLLDEAERILDAVGDRTSVRRGRLEFQRAEFLMADKRLCIAHTRKAVAVFRAIEPSPAELLDALFILSVCETAAGDPMSALATAQEALALQDARGIVVNRDAKFSAIALAQLRLGRIGAALESQRQALEISSRHLGTDQLGSASGLSVLEGRSTFLLESGQARSAVDVLSPTLDRIRDQALKVDRFSHIVALTQLARAHNRLGQSARSLRDLAEAQEQRKALGTSDLLSARLLDAQADALTIEHRLEEADEHLRSAGDLHRKLRHDHSPQINDHVAALVRLRLAQGRADDADRALGDYFVDRIEGQPATLTALAHDVMRSEILVAQSRWKEAADQASAVLDTLGSHPEARYLRDLEARARLARGNALLELGSLAPAMEQLQQAASLFAEHHDPQASPELARAYEQLAHGAASQGQTSQAREFESRAMAIRRVHRQAKA